MLASMAGTPGVDMVAAGSDKLLPFSGGASVTSLPVRLPSWARSRAPIALNPNIVHETPRYSTAAVAFAHAAREEIADAESRLLVRKIGSDTLPSAGCADGESSCQGLTRLLGSACSRNGRPLEHEARSNERRTVLPDPGPWVGEGRKGLEAP